MRKIPEEFENPIDNIIYTTVEPYSQFLKKYNFTPNGITTLSAIFGLLSLYCINKDKFFIGGLLYFVSYYFDCLDGYYARKYNMVTEFGDWYDHIKDLVIFAGITWILISKKFYINLALFVPLTILTLMHFGCQENYYHLSESNALNFTKYLCPCDKDVLERAMKTTRWFGSGTLVLLFSIFIMSKEFKK